MIIVFKYVVPKNYIAITLFPFIFLKNKSLKVNAVLINHEKIHLKQQLELLVIPFYIWYVMEFLVRLIQYRTWQKAYRYISFEREAYLNDQNLDYLNTRKFFGFLSYFKCI